LEIHEILESLKAGKIAVNDAKKLLSLYSIEQVEGFAKIDIDRRKTLTGEIEEGFQK
jgi:NCAIR mutase (PurE)-related protein